MITKKKLLKRIENLETELNALKLKVHIELHPMKYKLLDKVRVNMKFLGSDEEAECVIIDCSIEETKYCKNYYNSYKILYKDNKYDITDYYIIEKI